MTPLNHDYKGTRIICKVLLVVISILGSAIASHGQASTPPCPTFDSLFVGSKTPNGTSTLPFTNPVLDFPIVNSTSSELGSYNLGINVTIFPGFDTTGEIPPSTVQAPITAGALPPGLSLITLSCVYPESGYTSSNPLWIALLTGTPTTAGSFTFTTNFNYCDPSGCSPLDSSGQYHMVILPKFSQGDPQWANLTYDDYNNGTCQASTASHPNGRFFSHCHLQNSGCLITDLAMLFSGVGLYLPPLPSVVPYINPPILNDAAKGHFTGSPATGYIIEEGTVTGLARLKFSPPNLVSPYNLTWHNKAVPISSYYSGDRPQTLIDNLEGTLAAGFPVLVHVPHRNGYCNPPNDATLGHFVVVTNAQYDQTSPDKDSYGNHVRFYINDPGCATGRFLDDYAVDAVPGNLIFEIRGFLTDPTDFSYLTVSSSDNVNISLTDSGGNRVGYDPVSSQNVEEIPNSSYFRDVDDDLNGETMNSANVLAIQTPASGPYSLSITGGEGGFFGITVQGIATDGSMPVRQVITGTYVPGTPVSYSISYSSTPSEQLTVEPPQIVGDLNGDGKVDCSDLAIVKAAFGTVMGAPGFDPRADVNSDGVVNILDLSIVAKEIPAGTVCQ
jgi:hypothetical protein